MRKNKVDIITLGCSKNLVDSEQLMFQFKANGYEVRHDPQKINGEIVVVNTCAFIGDAQEESIQTILELEEAKKKGIIGKLFVMGCLSERFKKELQNEISGVDRYYGKFDWKNLLDDIGKAYNIGKNYDTGKEYNIGKNYKDDLANDRILTTPSHYAYLKIAEGCNRSCSFCAIPLITGKYKSRSIESIVAETHLLVAKGVKEIQLIAQDLTYYGIDLYKKPSLPELIERLSDVSGIKWIRLHYAYPAFFPLDLLRVIRERPNVCHYLDLALQHISDPVLKKMRRHITRDETFELIAQIRKEVPDIHLRTTLMVGHPGETEDDFNELIDFVKKIQFERLGAFAYSHETGTYSYINYKDTITDEIKQQRLDALMRIQQNISAQKNEKKIGQTLKTIIDRKEGGYYVGRTEYDSPDVDPEVLIKSNKPLRSGEFYNVFIEHADDFDLYGTASKFS